jgi:hypothetical protein
MPHKQHTTHGNKTEDGHRRRTRRLFFSFLHDRRRQWRGTLLPEYQLGNNAPSEVHCRSKIEPI